LERSSVAVPNEGRTTTSEATHAAERAEAILNELIEQRRKMRRTGGERGLLEANRLGIVYWQTQLTRARRSAGNSR